MRSDFRRNVVEIVGANRSTTTNARIILLPFRNVDRAVALLLLLTMTISSSMVAAFTLLDSHKSICTRQHTSTINLRLSNSIRPLQQQQQQLYSTPPTEEQDAITNDDDTTSAPATKVTKGKSSKSSDTANHFLKPDFIDAIHQKTGLTKKESENMYKVFTDIITEQLLNAANTDPNIKLKIPKFGTFYIKLRPERTGKNPRTGDPIVIAAAKIPSFTPATSLKELINGSKEKSSSSSNKKSSEEDEDDEEEE